MIPSHQVTEVVKKGEKKNNQGKIKKRGDIPHEVPPASSAYWWTADYSR